MTLKKGSVQSSLVCWVLLSELGIDYEGALCMCLSLCRDSRSTSGDSTVGRQRALGRRELCFVHRVPCPSVSQDHLNVPPAVRILFSFLKGRR